MFHNDVVTIGKHKMVFKNEVLSDEALNLVRLTTRPVLVYRDEKES